MIDLQSTCKRPPNERRHFVHKRIIGAVSGFVGSGFNPLGAVGGFLRSGGGGGAVHPTSLAPQRGNCPSGRVQTPAGCVPAPCPDGSPRSIINGRCGASAQVVRSPGLRGAAERFFPGGATGFEVDFGGQAPPGDAVMGRFGSALEPFVEDRMHRSCLPGMVLGRDGLCYNTGRNGIANRDRMWPKERKPLGTPGELNAVTTASRFAKRVQSNTKRLQKMGMLPKPKAGASRRQIAAEVRAEMHHAK